MEYVQLFDIISAVGFPIALVVFLLYYMKKINNQHREDMNKHIDRYVELQKNTVDIIADLKNIIKERIK